MSPSPFDFLINSEVIVEDVAIAERLFVDALGFPEPKASWSSTEPGFGFTWLFARVHPSMQVSPTRIEAMAVGEIDPGIDPRFTLPFLPEILAAQGQRPWKTHANELATDEVDAVEARLVANGCRYYSMPRAADAVPFTRLWIGWTAQDPGQYQPDVDGGLFLEVCESSGLGQAARTHEPVPDPDLPPGGMVRVLRRGWLVGDIAATLAALDRNLDLRPAVGPELDEERGCRRALIRFRNPRSAELELLQPIAEGEAKEAFDTWGPGSWSIRIGVNDLSAKAEDLKRRRTQFDNGSHRVDGNTLLVDTGSLGVPGRFEFASIAQPR